MKTTDESFDDIIFENRNKEYGAYELRKKYSKRGIIALTISMFILFTAVGWPLVASMMNDASIRGGLDLTDSITLADLNTDKPDAPPKLPEPPAIPKIQSFNQIIIVDSISKDELDLPTIDDINEKGNSSLGDTGSYVAEKIVVEDEPIIEKVVEVFELNEKPIFPDGDAGIIRYVSGHTVYPSQAIKDEIEGTVYVRFVVTKTGDVGEARVLRNVDPSLEEEAVRVVKSMPKWIPGKINGSPVNVWFIIPVKFVLHK